MTKPSKEHGIEFEPHLSKTSKSVDPSEAKTDALLAREWNRSKLVDHVEHNVWEEPLLARELNDAPGAEALTYANWLNFELQRTSRAKTWGITLLVILICGPLGIVGALFGGMTGVGQVAGLVQLVGAVIFGPITEEITKILLPLWIVEKRPHLFSSQPQILLCAMVGGLAFAAIENLVYFFIYVPDHTPAFEMFRWTACVALHVGCSSLTGIGLARIWRKAVSNRIRPQLADGVPWFYAAMTVHGLYNLSVTIADWLGWLDFLKD